MGLTSLHPPARKTSFSHLTGQIRTWLARLTTRALWLSLAGLIPVGLAAQAPGPTVKLSPETVQMGAFYNGTKVRIEGTAPAGSQVLVVIRGDERDEFFNKKGRVGPIWVNTDRIHVARAPSLLLCFGSKDANALLDRSSIETYQLDDVAIKNRMQCRSHCKCSTTRRSSPSSPPCMGVEPDPSYRDLIHGSFLALKVREGRYQTHPDAVRIVDSEGGPHYSLVVDWPRSAPPGSYQVEVYACRNRSVVARAATLLQVVEVGFPAQMATLASGHPWTYGVIAVLAAMVAGFAIDALTSRLRRRSLPRPRPTEKGEIITSPKPEPANPVQAIAQDAPEREHAHRS